MSVKGFLDLGCGTGRLLLDELQLGVDVDARARSVDSRARHWQPVAAGMSRERQLSSHSASRTLAALAGSLPVAVALGVALAALLPLRVEQRYLWGSYPVLPLWVVLACRTALAQSARRAWLGLAGVLGAAVLLTLLGHGLR
jgi:hypothetical protein